MTKRRRQETWAALGLAAAVFAVFGRTLSHGFVNYDDDQYVVRHPVVGQGLSAFALRWALGQVHHSNWHPLTTLSHMLDCQLYGLEPWGHHLTNLLLHAGAAAGLALAFARMTGKVWHGAAVAALFALHPLRVESVAWVSERKDLLSGVCFAATLLAYERYARSEGVPRRRWYAAVVAAFGLGLASKPMLVTLPCVLLLLDRWPLARIRPEGDRWLGLRSCVREKLPLLLLAAGSCALTLWAQGESLIAVEALPLGARLQNALASLAVYVAQLFWPVGLTPFYRHTGGESGPWRALAGASLLVGMLALSSASLRRRPYLAVGCLWYLGMLVPVLGFVQVGAQAHADRYTYLPQIGLCLALVFGVAEFCEGRGIRAGRLAGSLIALLAALGTSSALQARHWRDSESLWKHALAVDPRNHVALFSLGLERDRQGRLEAAAELYRQAIELEPRYAEAHLNYAVVSIQRGQLEQGIDSFRAAIALRPRHARAHGNLCLALVRQGQREEATRACRQAVELAPGDPQIRENLGMLLLLQGQQAEGLSECRAALAAAREQGDRSLAEAIARRLGENERTRRSESQRLLHAPGASQRPQR